MVGEIGVCCFKVKGMYLGGKYHIYCYNYNTF